jgi:hypothetical protein
MQLKKVSVEVTETISKGRQPPVVIFSWTGLQQEID